MAAMLSDETAARLIGKCIGQLESALDEAEDSQEDYSEVIANYATAIQAIKEASNDGHS